MEGIMALAIPIVAIVFSFGSFVAIIYLVVTSIYHRRKLEHEEIMLAIEKGVDVPFKSRGERNPFTWSFFFIAFGLALVIGMFFTGTSEWVFWAFLPILIGAGMLAAHFLFKKQKKKDETEISEIESAKGENNADQ